MDSKAAREKVKGYSIEDVYEQLKDGMELASRCGDIRATVRYATLLNGLDDILDMLQDVEITTSEG